MVSILVEDRRNSAYGIRHFVADNQMDVNTIVIQGLEPGSTVFVIENSKTFMLNSKKRWIEIHTGASSGGGSGGGGTSDNIYDGGFET